MQTYGTVTLPREICEQLGIGPGDMLELSVEEQVLIARPRKTLALEALKEAGRQVRREIKKERCSAE